MYICIQYKMNAYTNNKTNNYIHTNKTPSTKPSTTTKQTYKQPTQQFLSRISHILQQLITKHPQSTQQFILLNTAIQQSYATLLTKIDNKNKEILKLSHEPNDHKINQLMGSLLQEMSLYIGQFMKNYCDPNMTVFVRKLQKIVDMYQFRNVQFERFMPKDLRKSCSVGCQTYVEGHQLQGFMYPQAALQNQIDQMQREIVGKNNQISVLTQENDALNDQNYRLKQKMENYELEREAEQKQFGEKIQKLQLLLYNMKNQSDFKSDMNERNNINTVRSNPQINALESTQKKLAYKNMLKNVFEEMQQIQNKNNIDDSHYATKQQTCRNQNQWRFIYAQAISLEGILSRVQVTP